MRPGATAAYWCVIWFLIILDVRLRWSWGCCLPAGGWARAQEISRLVPTHWWVGVQYWELCLYGLGILELVFLLIGGWG